MKQIFYLLAGVVFGFALIKSEAASWYRIIEMFHFQSFQMYGVLLTAVITAFVGVELVKRITVEKFIQEPVIAITKKAEGKIRFPVGGIIFGAGWGIVGLCPGPIFALVGSGSIGALVVLFGALHGTWLYGLVHSRLPH